MQFQTVPVYSQPLIVQPITVKPHIMWGIIIVVVIFIALVIILCVFLISGTSGNNNNNNCNNQTTAAASQIKNTPTLGTTPGITKYANKLNPISKVLDTKILDTRPPPKITGYNYIGVSEYAADSMGPINDVELTTTTIKPLILNSSNSGSITTTTTSETCISICEETDTCKGVAYENKTCYILEEVPRVSGKAILGSSIYLKKEYKPKVVDKVFIGTVKSKLVSTDWWNKNDHYSNGGVNVFSVGIGKEWYLSERKYDVINSGKLIGVYSSKLLSDIVIKNLLDKDVHPPGVTCLVDIPTEESYQLDLSIFGFRSIFIIYYDPATLK
jgi:hypothetical protein